MNCKSNKPQTAHRHSDDSTGRNSALQDAAMLRDDAPWASCSLKVTQENAAGLIYIPTPLQTSSVHKKKSKQKTVKNKVQ